MSTFIVILHIFVCLVLILIVLLQAGKGAEMGATFGAGGSQSVFGSGGAAPFMTKLTTALAVIFMLTSIGLTIFNAREARKTVVEGISAPVEAKPAEAKPLESKPAEAKPDSSSPQVPQQPKK